MTKKLFFAIIVSTLISMSFSGLCSNKEILNDDYTLKESDYAASDRTLAFNGPASCATLSTDGITCCYIKIKFKNQQTDEKYTHKGCYALTESRILDIGLTATNIDDIKWKDIIKAIEQNFDNANSNLSSKKIDLDCNSKYLHYVGFALLFLLL